MASGGVDLDERLKLVHITTTLFSGILLDLVPFATVDKIATSLRVVLCAWS